MTLADAFFIHAFQRFLAGSYGLPFGDVLTPPGPGNYLLAATYVRFHEVTRLSIWVGGAVVTLLALGVASWFTRRFSRPITGFAAFADRIGKGEYTARLSEDQETQEFTKLSESLNRMAEDLNRHKEVEQELFSNLSHELRTPVTVIKGYVEALDGGVISDPQEVHVAVQAVAQETTNLESMINELRQLAQIDHDGVSPEESDFDLDEMLSYVCHRFAPLAAEHNIQFFSRLEAYVKVHLDRQLLDRSVANLLTNAITATLPGKSVILSSSSDVHGVSIVVEDEGAGIAAGDLPHVFERFFRGDRSRNHKNGGLGLGLPIARDLVEIEGGSIRLTSMVGQGTRVVITYPSIAIVALQKEPSRAS